MYSWLLQKNKQTLAATTRGTTYKNYHMEKRVLGIILSLMGIVGLIMAAVNFLNGGSGNHNIKEILIYTILGAVFFFAGISLVRTTKDRAS